MLTRKIERNDEEFVVEVSKDNKRATVTDERGTTVTIRYDSGNLNVRLPNGWGSWVPSMEAAVERAVKLCFESRKQLTADDAYQEMVDYVEGKTDE